MDDSPVTLQVHSLDKHLCSIQAARNWSGLQLKEAIEEATEWAELVCTQQLVVGVHVLQDDEAVGDHIQDTTTFQLLRLPLRKQLAVPLSSLTPTLRRTVALLLHQLGQSPCCVEMPLHGRLFDLDLDPDLEPDKEQTFIRNSDFVHTPLGLSDFMDWFSLDIAFGVGREEVLGVFALQAFVTCVGDGLGWLAGLLALRDGSIAAVAALLCEASSAVAYRSSIEAAVRRASSWEELQTELPVFCQALQQPPEMQGPQAGGVLPGSDDVLPIGTQRVAIVNGCKWTNSLPGPQESRCKFGRESLLAWPLRPFCKPTMPKGMLELLMEQADLEDAWTIEASDVGRNNPKMPFTEGVEKLRNLFPDSAGQFLRREGEKVLSLLAAQDQDFVTNDFQQKLSKAQDAYLDQTPFGLQMFAPWVRMGAPAGGRGLTAWVLEDAAAADFQGV